MIATHAQPAQDTPPATLWAWWNGGGVTHLGTADGPLCKQAIGRFGDGVPGHVFRPKTQGTEPKYRYCRRCVRLHLSRKEQSS